MNKKSKLLLLLFYMSTLKSVSVFAQADNTDLLELEEVIATGVAQPISKLDSSVSVSTLNTDEILNAAPRSTAEIFRNIPGIRTEASTGSGNAQLTVRGLPIPAGGSRFVLLQEDGLPTLQFGDINFGTADTYVKFDYTIDKVEAIRGGSASTLASNSPGGIINFISKTGAEAGGSLGTTIGLDYDSFRTDFEYGSPLNEDWNFHIGGYFREGEGVRDAGYSGNSGGQIKANLTKQFENGYARVYFKEQDDRAITYLQMPLAAGGGSIPGFDSTTDTQHSVYLLSNTGRDVDGNIRRGNVEDGIHSIVSSVGAELDFDLGNNWSVNNKFRKSIITGSWASPFTTNIGDAQDVADSIGGAGSTISYANGPNSGQTFPANANGNGLAQTILLFDVEIEDFGNFVNDLRFTKELNDVALTLGYYQARQNVQQYWVWNTYLMEVKGSNAALLDVTNSGEFFSDDGLINYGSQPFGQCCNRSYDASYEISAPYFALSYTGDRFTLDASVRQDRGNAFGTYASSVQETIDANSDGIISNVETFDANNPLSGVPRIDITNPSPINYSWNELSYSLGGNYSINDNLAVFSRYSDGARVGADRLLFGTVQPDGSLDEEVAIDDVIQFEVGVKYRRDNFAVFATLFSTETELTTFDFTQPDPFIDRIFETTGLEIEAAYQAGAFSVNGDITYTDAEISEDAVSPENEGNQPQRQPELIWSISPTYNGKQWNAGLNILGVGKSFTDNSNTLEMPAHTTINLFANYYITDAFSASLNINNLTDEVAVTEVGDVFGDNDEYWRGRTYSGTSTSLTLNYEF